MLGGWGFRFVLPIRGKIRKILINLQKSSYEPPNKVPRVMYGPNPGASTFT